MLLLLLLVVLLLLMLLSGEGRVRVEVTGGRLLLGVFDEGHAVVAERRRRGACKSRSCLTQTWRSLVRGIACHRRAPRKSRSCLAQPRRSLVFGIRVSSARREGGRVRVSEQALGGEGGRELVREAVPVCSVERREG